MLRPSAYLAKLEDKLVEKLGPWVERHKAKFPVYIPLGLAGWYFYGMFLNSIRLGTAATFHTEGEEVGSIWVFNPLRNWFVLFTPFGLGFTAVILLLICLITKKGYIWFSGYKFIRDPRGFDILPDATHGSSGFLTKKELGEFLELGSAAEVQGMMLGKWKKHPNDADKYAAYVAHRMVAGDNNNLLCIGAPGSGKSRGFIIPFMLGCAKRGESIFITDPKAELFEKMSLYVKDHGYCVRAVNFLDMAHSDGWNCLFSLDKETQLVQTVANTIIQNTSGPKEADDFWSRAELNLLMALIHYVCNLKDANGKLLPIEQRGLGDVYQLLANKSIQEINRTLAGLPVLVNFCLDEYCNIGYMDGIADALNSIRGFNMSCQVVVQSLSQWQEKYPGKEWENQLATFDQTLYMGANDLTSAEYISKKCGKVTISVTNNQMPLMPLFSPVYTSTRPYSQTRSNTQRDLMLPDEILRLDRRQCIALFQGHKPALLYKLAPEELPGYDTLKPCRVAEYVPEWKRREDEKKTSADQTPPSPTPEPPREEPPPAQKETVNPAQDLEYTVEDTAKSGGGIGLIDMSGVRGDDDADDEADSPPGR